MKHPMFFLVSSLAIASASAAQPTCPRVAPADWQMGQKPLKSVRVISYPVSEVPGSDREYYAAPPWDERENSGYLYQTWRINDDATKFKYEVDCMYDDTGRYLNLDVAASRQCVARWRLRGDHGVAPLSLNFSCK